MKKTKKAMALLLALSMVLMSGIFAFADGDVPLQDASMPVTETETTAQPENQQPEQAGDPSDKQGTVDENQKAQTPEDNKDGNVPEGETAKPDGTEDSKENVKEGENTPALLSTTEGIEKTQAATQPDPDYKETSVYLRYDNTVPTQILESSAQAEYGPKGDSNHPYFKVKVDLNKIEELCQKDTTKIKKYNGNYTYYSAQASPNVQAAEDDVKSCWNEILTAMSSEDQQKFIEYFGAGPNGGTNFIGYVFKSEADGWHIDGVLNVVPGYITEFYLNGTIKKTDVAEVAMTTQDATGYIESLLGAVSGTIKWNADDMGGTFERDNDVYQFTIRPGAYSPQAENVTYETKIRDAYYLARIYVDTKWIGKKPTEFDVQAIYKVEHYWKTDSGYELHETELLHGKIGTEVDATPKDYSQNGYNLNLNAVGTADKGTITLPSTDEKGELQLLTLKLYYDPVEPIPGTPEKAVYEVRYYLQQAKDSYMMVESQFPLYAEIGVSVTAEQKDFAGYVFNEEKSNASGEVVKVTREVGSRHLVLNMYYDIETPQPPIDPIVPDPVIPVTPPVIPDPVDPQPQPQPLPPDDPLIEEPDQPTVNPQPLPPDDPLIEEPDQPTVNPQPLPPDDPLIEDEHLADPTETGKAADPDQPKTGDEGPLMALTGLFLVSAGALGAIYIKRKKED